MERSFPMNVTCLLGSPRPQGNSTLVARRFIDKAAELGANVTTWSLNQIKFKGCQACMGCKTRKDVCVLEDDLTPVLTAVRETDVLVLATPVYFADVASPVKAFIDRTYSFVGPDYLTNPNASRLAKGKKLVFIQSQEGGPKAFQDIFPKYNLFLNFYGFAESRYILAAEVGPAGAVADRVDVMAQADEAADAFCRL
jgi:multimeric flavodoxin WrbA